MRPERPALIPSDPWARLAVSLWAILIVVVCARAAWQPRTRSLYQTYVRAGADWRGGVDVYWVEGKPLEGGRAVLVRHAGDGTRQELTPKPLYVRTRVHEYGGGAYVVAGSTVFFSNFADQRLYRQDAGADPHPITPEPATPAGLRYADAQVTPDGRLLVCVREVHESEGPAATNTLVVLAADGSTAARVIASGHDFYSSPRISPDGGRPNAGVERPTGAVARLLERVEQQHDVAGMLRMAVVHLH